MRSLVRAAIISLAVAAFGCTSLEVTKLESGTPGAPDQWTYSLPFEQFNVTATRTLVGCKSGGPLPVVEIKISATGSVQPDPDQTYEIDPQSLTSWTKISDLKVTWFPNPAAAIPAGASSNTTGAPTPAPTGGSPPVPALATSPSPGYTAMIQQVNGSAQDRTGQIITNTISALSTIATTIASGGVGGPAAAAAICQVDPSLQKLLDQKKGLDDALQAATDKLNTATARLKMLTTLASAAGTRLDAGTAALLVGANKGVIDATAAQTKAAAAVTKNQDGLTQTNTFTWPLSGETTAGANQILIPGGLDAITKFKLTTVAITPATAPAMARELSASLRIERLLATASAPPDAAETSSLSGLRYRSPVPGLLIVCMATPPAPPAQRTFIEATTPTGGGAACGAAARGDYMATDPSQIWAGPVPQLGALKTLPYSNGPFQNNMVAVTFNQDGSLASAERQEVTSRGETITATLASAAMAAAAGAKGVVTGPTDLLQAKVLQLTAQNNLITQQSNLSTAQQIGLLQANTALLNAQAGNCNAQVALGTARTAAQAALPQ
jgi:hypothetical protein